MPIVLFVRMYILLKIKNITYNYTGHVCVVRLPDIRLIFKDSQSFFFSLHIYIFMFQHKIYMRRVDLRGVLIEANKSVHSLTIQIIIDLS